MLVRSSLATPLVFLVAALSRTTAEASTNLSTGPRATVVNPNHGNVTFVGKAVDVDGVTVDAFLGIRYADPVTERFAPSTLLQGPLAADVVDGVTDATAYGAACAQLQAELPLTTTEDCLYLNIWRPNSTSSDPLPVMVWIHGGGLKQGAGSEPLYDGARLAGTENIIVVTLNYRLGGMGFLVTGPDGKGGLNGVLDQIRALEWLNRSISSFGGDPSQVTVAGQSGGATSVCLLSVSPLAQGLFHRAILESNQCISEAPYGAPLDPEVGDRITKQVLEAAQVEDVESLKNLTAEEFMLAWSLVSGPVVNGEVAGLQPTLDRAVVPASPTDLYLRGLINPTDMIVGSNTYDNSDVAPCAGFVGQGNESDQAADFEAYLLDRFDEADARDIFSLYSPDDLFNGSSVAAYIQFRADFQRLCFGRELAALVSSKVDGKVYSYKFGHNPGVTIDVCHDPVSTIFADDPTYSFHSAEVLSLFGNPPDASLPGNATAPAPTAEDETVRAEMMVRWANFVKSGDPQLSSESSPLVEWQPVPKSSLAAPGGAASDPPYLFLTGSGGEWVPSDERKTKQCAPSVRMDSWSRRGDGHGQGIASFSDIRGDRGKEITRGASEGPVITAKSEPLATRKRSGRQRQLRSQHIWQEEGDTAAMLQMPGAALPASGNAGHASEEL